MNPLETRGLNQVSVFHTFSVSRPSESLLLPSPGAAIHPAARGPIQCRRAPLEKARTAPPRPPQAQAFDLRKETKETGPGRICQSPPATGLHRPIRCAMKNPTIDQAEIVPGESLSRLIHSLREQRVILDRDLAALYGVETRSLNQAVKRNEGRFPSDFMFELTRDEILGMSQSVISLAK